MFVWKSCKDGGDEIGIEAPTVSRIHDKFEADDTGSVRTSTGGDNVLLCCEYSHDRHGSMQPRKTNRWISIYVTLFI